MGFWSTIKEFGGDVVEKISRGIDFVAERVGRVVEAIKELDFGKVIEEVGGAVTDVLHEVKEFGGPIVKALEFVTGVTIESIQTVVETVTTIGRFVAEHIADIPPQQLMQVAANLVGAAAHFISGNYAMGAVCLVQTVKGFIAARDVVEVAHPEITGQYLLPAGAEAWRLRDDLMWDGMSPEEMEQTMQLSELPEPVAR